MLKRNNGYSELIHSIQNNQLSRKLGANGLQRFGASLKGREAEQQDERAPPPVSRQDQNLSDIVKQRKDFAFSIQEYLWSERVTAAGYTQNAEISKDESLFAELPAYFGLSSQSTTDIAPLWFMLRTLLPVDPLNHRMKTGVSANFLSYAPTRSGNLNKNELPLGWSLATLQPSMNSQKILWDGTTTRHLPGPARVWPYRLWLSGSIRHSIERPPQFDQNADVCMIENVVDVREEVATRDQVDMKKDSSLSVPLSQNVLDTAKPEATNHTSEVVVQKTFIPLRNNPLFKTISQGSKTIPQLLEGIPSPKWEENGIVSLAETYKLGFFQEKIPHLGNTARYLTPHRGSVMAHSLTITRHHLFCWSAVTQNTHLIHIDREFAKLQYGAKDLLVQGPYMVFLILEWLRRDLTRMAFRKMNQFRLYSIEYKILQPVFVDENITFLAKPIRQSEPGCVAPEWKIWIEKNMDDGRPTLVFSGHVKVQTQRGDSSALANAPYTHRSQGNPFSEEESEPQDSDSPVS